MKSGAGGGKLPAGRSAIVLVLVMGLPILWLAFAALSTALAGGGLAPTMLPTALRETATLMAWVGLLTGVLGLVSAWLVTHFDFPLRRLFEWALVLPLAVPTYLAAYTYVEFLDFTGPIQQAVRAIFGGRRSTTTGSPTSSSPSGAAIVLSMRALPLRLRRAAPFSSCSRLARISPRARSGRGACATFFTITLPLSRPALVVGMTLAMMEVVNDLGAVQYFGVNSLTAIIYSTWINRSNFGGAAQLAVMIVLIIGLLILLEQWARRNRVYCCIATAASHPSARTPVAAAGTGCTSCSALSCWRSASACGAGQLLVLAIRNLGPSTIGMTLSAWPDHGDPRRARRHHHRHHRAAVRPPRSAHRRSARALIRIATLGYAIPGTVLALGLLQPLGQADLWFNRMTMAIADWRPGLILSGSIGALLYLYAIRFLACQHSTSTPPSASAATPCSMPAACSAPAAGAALQGRSADAAAGNPQRRDAGLRRDRQGTARRRCCCVRSGSIRWRPLVYSRRQCQPFCRGGAAGARHRAGGAGPGHSCYAARRS
jgi:iron(III) transport system permease protein